MMKLLQISIYRLQVLIMMLCILGIVSAAGYHLPKNGHLLALPWTD